MFPRAAFETAPSYHQVPQLSHSRSSITPKSRLATFLNACLSGRIPLILVLVLILTFVVWHVYSDQHTSQIQQLVVKQQEQLNKEAVTSLTKLQTEIVANPRHRLPVKSHYRFLLVGDSLTVGYYWANYTHELHPYKLHLEEMLQKRHPHLSFELVMEAEGGECVISTCTTKSMLERVKDRLASINPETKQREYYDLAVIMGGTNDIYHDFDAKDVSNGLDSLHKLIWNQEPPNELPPASATEVVANAVTAAHASKKTSPIRAKTIGMTVPQWGNDDSWRPSKRQSKLLPAVAHAARGEVNSRLKSMCQREAAYSEQCNIINLDEWFPRHTLSKREFKRKWAEDIHPSPYGYDEIGLIVYQHLVRILPQT